MHHVLGSVRSVTNTCYGLSVLFSISLILADLHILYATKQNKNHYHQTTFSGLKIATKYVCRAPDSAGVAYRAPPDPIAALEGWEEKVKGWEGRGRQERGGERVGKGKGK